MMMLFDLSGSMIVGSLGGARADRSGEGCGARSGRKVPPRRPDRRAFESHDVRARIENAVFAETRGGVEAQIDSLQARRDGNTALYSATIFALNRLKGSRRRRRTVNTCSSS